MIVDYKTDHVEPDNAEKILKRDIQSSLDYMRMLLSR